MALSESAATSAAGPQPMAQDTQTLIALLGNLMPLLVRLQSQTTAEPFQIGPLGFVPQSATLDHQAATSFVEDIIADRLRALSTYLETHSKQYSGLEACMPLVNQAVQCYTGRDYTQAFNLIWQAYRSIAALQAVNPQLPPLRVAGAVTPAMTLTHH